MMKTSKRLFLSMVVAILSFGSLFGTAGADTLKIEGSTTVLPIAQKAAEAFMKANPGVNVSVSGGGSGNGIKAIVDGTIDVATSSRFIKDKEIANAVKNNIYPVPFAVAYDCIVPVVHPSNPVNDLTIDQLKGIYEGKIRNWKEVGGDDLQIVVISRDTSSGTYEIWEEKVLQGSRVSPAAMLQASSGAVVQAVSKNRYAIAYVGLSYLNKDVKATKVNGVEASLETAAAFPVSRPLFMFTKGWPTGTTLQFMNFLLHPRKGQQIVSEAGYIPLY